MGGRALPRTPGHTHAQPPPSSTPRQTLLTTDEPALTRRHHPEPGVFTGTHPWTHLVGLDKCIMTWMQWWYYTEHSHCPKIPLCGRSKMCTVGSRCCLAHLLFGLFSYCSVFRVFCTFGYKSFSKYFLPVCSCLFILPEIHFKDLLLWVDTAFERDILAVLNLNQKSNISKCPSHYESFDRWLILEMITE